MDLLLRNSVCLPVLETKEHRPLRMMSSPGLTSEAQLRYLLQWFGEFSELQKEDFLPILAVAKSGQPDQLAVVLSGLNCQDKPMSLFQCRIKLFKEWFPTWSEEEQDRLVKGVSETDPDFGTKLQDHIINGPKINGDSIFEVNGTNGDHIEEEAEVQGELVEQPQDNLTESNIPVEITAAS